MVKKYGGPERVKVFKAIKVIFLELQNGCRSGADPRSKFLNLKKVKKKKIISNNMEKKLGQCQG